MTRDVVFAALSTLSAVLPSVASATAAVTLAASTCARAQPAPFQGLTLQDQQDRRIDPASLLGKALLLNFIYTGCSTTCPVQVHELVLLQHALPADVRARLQFLSVTVDPQNDTSATLAAFARRQQADLAGWRFATGNVQQVNTLIDRMAASDPRRLPRRAEDHRTSLWLYDREGSLVQRYAGVPVDRSRLIDEITQLVRTSHH